MYSSLCFLYSGMWVVLFEEQAAISPLLCIAKVIMSTDDCGVCQRPCLIKILQYLPLQSLRGTHSLYRDIASFLNCRKHRKWHRQVQSTREISTGTIVPLSHFWSIDKLMPFPPKNAEQAYQRDGSLLLSF